MSSDSRSRIYQYTPLMLVTTLRAKIMYAYIIGNSTVFIAILLSHWSGVDAAADTANAECRATLKQLLHSRNGLARPTGHPHGAVPLFAELNTGRCVEIRLSFSCRVKTSISVDAAWLLQQRSFIVCCEVSRTFQQNYVYTMIILRCSCRTSAISLLLMFACIQLLNGETQKYDM